MKDFYTINDIALMSGLSTRTIRSYLKSGLLEGDKSDGSWQFTTEQVNAFLAHPSVFSSSQAKRNGVVFSFLSDRQAEQDCVCTILDLPSENGKDVSSFFCNQYNAGDFGNKLQFHFEDIGGYPRVIISGQMEAVLKLLNLFYQSRGNSGGAL